MRLLLDTPALIWWLKNDTALSKPALSAIADSSNDIFVSAASAWEIATKHRIGKLPVIPLSLTADIEPVLLNEGFLGLPVSLRHGQVAGQLPGPHRDPFDRMLMAQAMTESLVLVSNERLFDSYGVARLW